jgi:hypothetical protein
MQPDVEVTVEVDLAFDLSSSPMPAYADTLPIPQACEGRPEAPPRSFALIIAI